MADAPWIFISPLGCAWAAFTAGIVGGGIHLLRRAPPDGENAMEDAAVDDELNPAASAVVGAALIGTGLYLAAPGALRVAFMYGGS